MSLIASVSAAAGGIPVYQELRKAPPNRLICMYIKDKRSRIKASSVIGEVRNVFLQSLLKRAFAKPLKLDQSALKASKEDFQLESMEP